MNVGLVTLGGLDPSGEERTIPVQRALVARLARHHDVRVIALHQPDAPPVFDLDSAQILVCRRPATLRAVQRLMREHRRRPFDILHAFWAIRPGMVATWCGRRLGVPVLVHVAGGELVSLPAQGYGGARSWWGRVLAHYTLRHAALATGATAPICLAAARWAGRVERVPLGVDLQRWPVCPPRPRMPGPLRLAWVGSINRVKGPDVLVAVVTELVRRRVDFTLDVVGEDTLDGFLQSRVASHGLGDRVRVRGWLRQHALHAMLRGADLLVHSGWHEAGRVVVLEAALVGVPTVGTAVGHVAEWSPGSAVAVPVGDVGALARAVEALAADEPRRVALARAAQARAVAVDADWTAERFLALYRDVVPS